MGEYQEDASTMPVGGMRTAIQIKDDFAMGRTLRKKEIGHTVERKEKERHLVACNWSGDNQIVPDGNA